MYIKIIEVMSNTKTIVSNEAKMKVINANYRVGDVSKVAESTGFSESYTSRVLRGERNNEAILNKAYNNAKRRKN